MAEGLSEVEELTLAVGDLSEQLKKTSKELAQIKRSNSRHRMALIAASIGIVLDLMLSGLFIYQHEKQVCTNNRSQRFFAAEVKKVNGQVEGLQEIKRNPTDPAKVSEGFNQFIDASQHYLDTIHTLPRC